MQSRDDGVNNTINRGFGHNPGSQSDEKPTQNFSAYSMSMQIA